MTASSRLDHTHDPSIQSWVLSANESATDFPIQNLPFGMYRLRGTAAAFRPCTAIGTYVADLLTLRQAGVFDDSSQLAASALEAGSLNLFMAQSVTARLEFRHTLFDGLRAIGKKRAEWQSALVPMDDIEMALPARIGDYTDFYTGIHHATAVGRLFRPDNPLLPNYKWVPIGYHGRSSSFLISGKTFKRPAGQTKDAADTAPKLGPTKRLDYELELGIFIGSGNELGSPVKITEAEEHIFGLVLLNDWSARDLQAWEYQPLGPFLAKNFASTISPWIVTMEALEPFRAPFNRPAEDPQPLEYLSSNHTRTQGALEVNLEVWIQTEKMRLNGQPHEQLMRSNFRDSYWTMAQLLTHHTVGGCNLQAGDLLGTGTQSGPDPSQGGSLLELSVGGKSPIKLSNGELRNFLQDGDSVLMRAHAERDGYRRIGFGECEGTVLPSGAG